MGAFCKPSEEPAVKGAKRRGATLTAGSSDGTRCAAIAEQMSAGARSLWRKTLSLSPPCGWVHSKLAKWVKSTLALTFIMEQLHVYHGASKSAYVKTGPLDPAERLEKALDNPLYSQDWDEN